MIRLDIKLIVGGLLLVGSMTTATGCGGDKPVDGAPVTTPQDPQAMQKPPAPPPPPR